MDDSKPQIYPLKLAMLCAQSAGKKYRPSNGHESGIFFGAWCNRCARNTRSDDPDNDDCGCDILLDSFAFNVDDEDYPTQLIIDDRGQPCCTAFQRMGDQEQTRCDRTVDMFGGAHDAT